jgi:hypothetical protein
MSYYDICLAKFRQSGNKQKKKKNRGKITPHTKKKTKTEKPFR